MGGGGGGRATPGEMIGPLWENSDWTSRSGNFILSCFEEIPSRAVANPSKSKLFRHFNVVQWQWSSDKRFFRSIPAIARTTDSALPFARAKCKCFLWRSNCKLCYQIDSGVDKGGGGGKGAQSPQWAEGPSLWEDEIRGEIEGAAMTMCNHRK